MNEFRHQEVAEKGVASVRKKNIFKKKLTCSRCIMMYIRTSLLNDADLTKLMGNLEISNSLAQNKQIVIFVRQIGDL